MLRSANNWDRHGSPDEHGQVLGCQTIPMTGTSSAKEAEALGAREALKRILGLRVENVILEMDAKAVV